ncbi:MAG: AAA family ATPase [Proteobacteria bacterium]|nr:AAA family ATPase [Pseudomonadota bacterium]
MDRVKNPFAPGAGTRPPAFAGRDELIENIDVLLARIKEKRSAKSMFFVGLRGVGKTVLLNHVKDVAEQKFGYQTVFIEAPENKRLADLLVPHLLRLLYTLDYSKNVNAQVKKAFRALRSFAGALKVKLESFEVSIEPERGLADSGDLETDLPALLVTIAEAAESKGIPCLLLIDEMQYLSEDEFRALITAMHKIAQRQLPFVLVGAGLPQLVGVAGEAKSYAERLFDFPRIGALNAVDAEKALKQPVAKEGAAINKDAIGEIIKMTQGYPYFLQEWGSEAWNIAPRSPITLTDVKHAHTSVIKKLDDSFFRVRLDRLTPLEKNYLRAMAELGPGPHRSGDIAAELGKQVNSVAPVRNSLIKKGMIYSPTHGDTAFTVPLFDQFMKRAMPGRV